MNALINYLDKYTNELVFLQMGILVILVAIILAVYFYNRKKYHNLKHQIPASVVKDYLDSIIQNSTALKSSLFRGGGLDVDPSGIPSVFPLDQLAGAGQATSGGDEALRSEVARLQSQLAEKTNALRDLEGKNTSLSGEVKAKQERIEELERLIAEGGQAVPEDNSALIAELESAKAERDQLREDLNNYNVIADDLADLKRYKQENEQLRKALEESGGNVSDVVSDTPVAEEPAPAIEEPAIEEPVAEELAPAIEEPVVEEPAPTIEEPTIEEPAPTAEAAPVEAPAEEEQVEEKTPEDLLSEFEKMLG